MEALKANEIMIGDWMWVNDIEHLRPLQIGALKPISGSLYAELGDPNDATEHCQCIITKLVPIMITDGILYKSGFRLGTGQELCGIFDWIWRDTRTNTTVIVTQGQTELPRRIFIRSNARTAHVNTDIDAPIQHVHELQHLLSFCGIPLEIKI